MTNITTEGTLAALRKAGRDSSASLVERLTEMQVVWISHDSAKQRIARADVSAAGLRQWFLTNAYFSTRAPRWMANIHSKCPFLTARQALLEDMKDEELGEGAKGDLYLPHYELLCRMAGAVGIPRQEMDAASADDSEVVPLEAIMACAAWDNWTRTEHWVIGTAIIGAIEGLTTPTILSHIGGGATDRRKAWAQKFGLQDDDMLFFRAHEVMEEGHSSSERQIVEEYGEQLSAELRERLIYLSRQSLAMWWLMWEATLAMAGD